MTREEWQDTVARMTPDERTAMLLFANSVAFMAACARDPSLDLIPSPTVALDISLASPLNPDVEKALSSLIGGPDVEDQGEEPVLGQDEEIAGHA